MARRGIGQEAFGFVREERGRNGRLDEIAGVLDWAPVERLLADIHAATKGEPGWPPLALLKALLLGLWHDLSDVALAEALDDRASFRRFCGFSTGEATPERTAVVRFRRELVARGLADGSSPPCCGRSRRGGALRTVAGACAVQARVEALKVETELGGAALRAAGRDVGSARCDR